MNYDFVYYSPNGQNDPKCNNALPFKRLKWNFEIIFDHFQLEKPITLQKYVVTIFPKVGEYYHNVPKRQHFQIFLKTEFFYYYDQAVRSYVRTRQLGLFVNLGRLELTYRP